MTRAQALLKQAILAAADPGRVDQPFAVGEVSAVPSGQPVQVMRLGVQYEASHLAGYVPSVGDVVLMARHYGQLVILDSIV